MSSRTTGRTGSQSARASAGFGVLAAAVGYVVTYALIVTEARERFDGEVADWNSVAWYFYSAHRVELDASGAIGSFTGSSTIDLIAQSGSSNAELLYVVPPAILVLTGAILAYNWGVTDLGDAVAVGAPVTLGYAAVMTIGVFVTKSSFDGSFFGISVSGSMAPALEPAILLAGVLYPLVFATAGAVGAAILAGR